MSRQPARSPHPRRGSIRQPGLAMLAVVCYLLQQLLVPLHCFLHDHHVGGSSQQAHSAVDCPDIHGLAHAGADHLHGAEHSEQGEVPSDEHAPHPIDDHLSEQVERLVLRTTLDPPTVAWFRAPTPWLPPSHWAALVLGPQEARPLAWARDLDPARGPPSTV